MSLRGPPSQPLLPEWGPARKSHYLRPRGPPVDVLGEVKAAFTPAPSRKEGPCIQSSTGGPGSGGERGPRANTPLAPKAPSLVSAAGTGTPRPLTTRLLRTCSCLVPRLSVLTAFLGPSSARVVLSGPRRPAVSKLLRTWGCVVLWGRIETRHQSRNPRPPRTPRGVREGWCLPNWDLSPSIMRGARRRCRPQITAPYPRIQYPGSAGSIRLLTFRRKHR